MGVNSDIEALLSMQVIAVAGCSPNLERPSHQVAAYLKDVGYEVIPVNPGHKTILGLTCYASLLDIPKPVDVVDVFRKSEFVPEIVNEAIKIKAKGLWLQDGIDDPGAVALARKSGLTVVVNDCLMRQHLSRVGR